MLQDFVSEELSEQGEPPCAGAGLSHRLDLDVTPVPQDWLHTFQEDQLPYCPSTKENVPDYQLLYIFKACVIGDENT